MAFHDPYRWYDPFEMVEEMESYLYEQERENERRLHWALGEMARHRSMLDAAFRDALAKYAPAIPIDASGAMHIMDSVIHSRMASNR